MAMSEVVTKRLSSAQRKLLLLCADGGSYVTPRYRTTALVLHERGFLDKFTGRPLLTERGRAKLAEELKPYDRNIDWAALHEKRWPR